MLHEELHHLQVVINTGLTPTQLINLRTLVRHQGGKGRTPRYGTSKRIMILRILSSAEEPKLFYCTTAPVFKKFLLRLRLQLVTVNITSYFLRNHIQFGKFKILIMNNCIHTMLTWQKGAEAGADSLLWLWLRLKVSAPCGSGSITSILRMWTKRRSYLK
jgi:hypothetical protein